MPERSPAAKSPARAALADTAAPAGLATLVLLVVALFWPATLPAALRAYILVLGLLAVWVFARRLAAVAPPADETPLARARRRTVPPSARPEELERLAATIRFAAGSGAEAHQRLRPLLREIAAQRLAERRGIMMDKDPTAARAALGETAWEWLRPERPAPLRRGGRGLSTAALRAIVDALEKV